MLALIQALFSSWTWRMAWRDSRRSRGRLLLYSSAIVLGVAALIAIGSLGENLADAIEQQAKSLLGADLVVASRDEFSPEAADLVRSLGGEQAREISFSSMVYFPKGQGTRLVQVRALEGGFPFYGTLEAVPKSALPEFRQGGGALVEESLLKQFSVVPGDPIKIGEAVLTVLGSLQKVPGETVAFGTIAPRVYMSLADLPKTGLIKQGSLVRHKVYFRFGPEVNVGALVKRLRPDLEKYHLETDTVERRKQELGRAMTNLYHFLNLVGFVALLLGGVGIASAIHVHVKQKVPTVAILRLVGCSSSQAFAIYLSQAFGLGVAGVSLGVGLGLAVQQMLPAILGEFLPFKLSTAISWSALARGFGLGLLICLVFALLPLLPIRLISALAVFRSSVEGRLNSRRDPLVWGCYLAIAAAILGFSVSQSRHWPFGVAFAGGLGLAFGLLAGLAKALVLFVQYGAGKFKRFTWRQGLFNLSRPNNRTVLTVLSLGLGTFLILTLYLLETNLVRHLIPRGQEARPDAVLFDIQRDQIGPVAALLQELRLPVLQDFPMVGMRLASVKGRSVEELRRDPEHPIPRWALRREYRSTYRDHLEESEKLLSGVWQARVDKDTSPIPVSVEEGIAKTLQVGLGDELVFDLQGVPVKTVVSSLREVDWRRMQPNFFVVFPVGVLEEAPSFHVIVTRVGTSERSAQMQREVVRRFPNVSTIDLTLVLQTVDSILSRISFVVRFMALFTVGTGLLVLVASILTGRYQRIQESILLRTLGASGRQIVEILLVEYLSLGALAAVTGILMATAASWGLARYVFHVGYDITVWPLATALLIVSTLTALTGMLASRSVCRYPPLEILRKEQG